MSARELLDRLEGDLTAVSEAIDNAEDFDTGARDLFYLSLGRIRGALAITTTESETA